MNYKAPITDNLFLLQEIFADERTKTLPTAINETIDNYAQATMEQMANLCAQVLLPANQVADKEGCTFNNTDGEVDVSPALAKAFNAFCDSGWMGMAAPEHLGGQALPDTITAPLSEMITSANHAFSMFPALTMGAIRVLANDASQELQETYLRPMIDGQWTGTMCMTEAHCGSDLGLIRTKALDNGDGSYNITGQKIFISTGEHKLTDNIIHLVLARLVDAPKGIKGLSLFLVPKKRLINGKLEDNKNGVHCVGIEEKMGIHANPTCTMSFENAEGYLIGEANKGLRAMFTMMNNVRLGTAMQGVGLCERSFQTSYAYATERRQMRALTGPKHSLQEADTLLVHPDIRRMLLTQKAFAEGGRALCNFCALQLDIVKHSDDPTAREEADGLLQLLTPLAKGFLTEMGLESASLAIQVYGGHGYISDNGVEQLYRDGRIATLYEGTTGIQSLDLLGRKVLGNQGEFLGTFTKRMHKFCSTAKSPLAQTLLPYCKEWPELAMDIGIKALENPDEAGGAAYDFLMYSGYVSLAFMWLQITEKTEHKLTNKSSDIFSTSFCHSKLKTAQFYFDRILPRANQHKLSLLTGCDNLMAMDEGEWLLL